MLVSTLKFGRSLFVTASVLALASCGGGSGSSSSGGGTTGGGGTSGGGGGATNVAPTFTGDTSFTFSEGQFVSFQLTISDPDSSTVTVTDDTNGDGAFFSVDTNGVVTATTAGNTFDFENPLDTNGDNVYEQNITLSDGTDTTTTTIRVTIQNVDEAPDCNPVITLNFNENVSGVIGDLTGVSSDPENDQITGYALSSIGRTTTVEQETLDAFSVNSTSGEISVSPALDAEKVGVEGVFTLSTITNYGTQFVTCQTNLQLVDVPGVVTSGVKLDGDQEFADAVGDVDNDGLTDFVLTQRIFSRDTADILPPTGKLIFGSTINSVLAVDGGETLNLDDLSSSQLIDIVGNYPEETDSSGTAIHYSTNFTALGDIDGDGLGEIGVGLSSVGSASFNDTLPYAYVIWGDAIAADTDGIIDLATATASEALQIFAPAGSNHWLVNVSHGDMDGNGTDDLLIGAPFAEITAPTMGLNFVVFGESLSAAKAIGRLDLPGTTTQSVNVSDANPSEAFGEDLSSAGDLNGDGNAEMVAKFQLGAEVVFGQEIEDLKNGVSSVNAKRVTLYANREVSISDTQGDADGDNIPDVLVAMPNDVDFAALAYGSGINAASDGDIIFLDPDNPTFETVIFESPGNADDLAIASSADFLGDLDGDGQDEIALLYVPLAPAQSVLYIVKGSALNGVTNNRFEIANFTTAQGLKIIDPAEREFNFVVTVLDDIDSDGFEDILISGPQDGTKGYLIPSSDIITALANGDETLDIQANFNDETVAVP